MRLFGVILAGGQGRRMGGADKALLRLAGRTLVARSVDRLEPQVERLAISANGDAARFGGLGLPVLADDAPQGPLSGVLAGLDWAAPLGATAIVTVAVDCPFFPGDLVPQLALAAERSAGGVALARSGGDDHPTFGLWPVGLRGALRDFLASGEKARVRAFADMQGAARADFAGNGAFGNLNTPDDLARAEAMIGAGI
ncbi:molybdenum cofactor guanylyltransferase MobA [Paragemmobacter straminiformis]|uniref:Molybdenum cofactor guanylyltransferase n=1 Tax=Paragemmobacter straminiformis TaxID=2045119 RepID=A0A842I6L4_9RHOB|nr:molybdenum cofactor guanylyltransferase MobA [Gemmobacter straminiformis]